jgi:phenylpyruvate tautomerase PptA (4-oxalocrotonate tautomerase family)
VPIITVESSVHLPESERSSALATLVASATMLLAIAPPTQLRLRITDVPPGSFAIGALDGVDGEPWIVAYVDVLDGRPADQLGDFMTEFAAVVASVFAVDAGIVRVLIRQYAKAHWQIGRRSAAAAGR